MRMIGIFLLLLLLTSITGAATYVNVSEKIPSKISFQVKSQMLDKGKVPVIIILRNQTSIDNLSKKSTIPLLKNRTFNSQRNLLDILTEEKMRGKAEKIKQFWIVNAIAVNASPELIEKLSKNEEVAYIQSDSVFHILEYYPMSNSTTQIANATSEIKRINTTKVWEAGIDGTGINVSVIDTGINSLNPDIIGRVINWVDYAGTPPRSSPYDDNGHGTHVAGTIGGNGIGGITTGVAPNVSLLIAKVCDFHGYCFDSDIIDATQWSVEHNSDVISISLGGSRDIALKIAIDNAVDMGVVVIAAAGNSGPGSGTVEFPGGEKNVIAVGAVGSSDNIASFSSRGPIIVDGEVLIKPDVSAPGISIISLNYLSNGYTIKSGTSMATPHVSGATALILQAARKKGIFISPDQVKNILENTSVDLGDTGKDNTYGAGRIDVFEATQNYILPIIKGTIIDSTTKRGIPGAVVTTNTSIMATANASGFYSFMVPPGTYNLTATSEPRFYINRSSIITVMDGTVTQDIELSIKPTGNISGLITNK